MGSGANDTSFLRDFSPASSKYCSLTPASLPPSHWARSRIPVAGSSASCCWECLSQIILQVCPRCPAKTRRNKSTSQFFPEFPFKLPLLCYFPHFSGKIWSVSLKLFGTESGKIARSFKSSFLRKLAWNGKSWMLSVKEKCCQDPAFIFPNVLP